jgi:hypothetical protein
MHTLLEQGLKIVQGEIKVENVTEGFSLELHGAFKMQRGIFQQECSYYGRMYVSRFGDNIIGVEDWEIQEVKNVKLGELPIDCISTHKKSLESSGLTTLAKSIGFSDEEEAQALFNTILNHKDFKKCYGKKATLWNLLSKEEQKLQELRYVCNNFTTCGEYMKKEIGKHYGIDTELDPNDDKSYITIVPSLEVCQAKLAELTK